jgi:hypothetical protein
MVASRLMDEDCVVAFYAEETVDMTARSIKHVGFFALVVAVTTMASPGTSRADFNVAPGWDLFTTEAAGTSFTGLGPLMGVPLVTFDFDNTFGRGLGVKGVDNADTIVRRDLPVIGTGGPPPFGSSPLTMVALQLETVVPVNFAGNGLDNYFVTLQSARGGPASTGSIALSFLGGQNGAFTSTIDVFFDIRRGSLNGAIVFSSDLLLTSDPTFWSSTPPPGALQIPGVNVFLSGTSGDRSRDFWPSGQNPANLVPVSFTEREPNGSMHTVHSTPEPTSIALLGIGAFGVGAYGWKRRRAA